MSSSPRPEIAEGESRNLALKLDTNRGHVEEDEREHLRLLQRRKTRFTMPPHEDVPPQPFRVFQFSEYSCELSGERMRVGSEEQLVHRLLRRPPILIQIVQSLLLLLLSG